MTMTAIVIPKKELRRGEKRYEDNTSVPAWDLYLDGKLVASGYMSQTAAQMELDLVAWYALFGEAPLSPDKPSTDEALGIALTVFNRCFTVLKVQEKARTALENIIKAGIYTINADGSLSVLASSGKGKTSYVVKAHTTPKDGVEEGAEEYQVTTECECRDFWTRAHDHGGVCKHVAARLLLFLAQLGVAYLKHLRDALDTHEAISTSVVATAATADHHTATADSADEDTMAFLDISASELAAALFLAARAGTPVEVRAERGRLHLVAGTIDLTFPCLDGHGIAAVRLEADAYSALYDQLRPVVKSAGAITVFVEPSDGLVYLCGQDETFSAEAKGETIRIVTAPTPEPEPAPAPAPVPAAPMPATNNQIAEALYELFTLLERHEPEWYQRRHFRIANEALQRAGRIA